MIRTRSLTTALLLGSALIIGCTSHTTKPEQYSGFLKDYSGLEQTQSASGKEVMRWRKANFKMTDYGDLVFQPAAFYPAPQPNDRVSRETLQQILDYANKTIGPALQYRVKEAQTPGPRTLRFNGAITGVGAADQGLKPYEVIPIALVVASAQTASGHRTQNTEMFLESEFTDVESGEVLMKVVRKVMGKTVNNEQQPVVFDDLKEAIDDLAKDIRTFK
ncbi:MAG: DUF3313 domain-containing protein [Spongiibacteraceae bacterium]